MQLAPSLHRLGGSTIVNSYVIADATGVTLIDAGLPGYWKQLPDELAAMGRTLDDIRGVVLTHGDTDHIGFAERIRRERGVSVFVHRGDADRARGEVSKPSTGWGPLKVRPLLGFLWYSARNGGLRIPRLGEVVPFDDGATLDLPGSPRVIHMPGHTPGSAAFHVPSVDALFLGDAMTTHNVLTGANGPRIAPFTLAPDEARASWGRLEGIDARWVLVGHGDPWDRGVQEALSEAKGR
jgi:glyoxylase-like metal-dependent hydrolase (beta-lactamase superfamily II)